MTKEEILQEFSDINHVYNNCTKYDTLKRMLDELTEPKTGHWIECEDNTSFVKQIPRMWLECSCCKWSCDRGYKTRYKYCPNCGAKMVEPQESEGEQA